MVSVESVNEVLSTLLAAEEGEGKSSVRRAQRVNYAGQVQIAFADKTTMVALHDISARGLSFYWPQQVKVGANFTARLERADGGTVQIVCQVVHCRPREQGQFNIGAEFKQIVKRGPVQSAA